MSSITDISSVGSQSQDSTSLVHPDSSKNFLLDLHSDLVITTLLGVQDLFLKTSVTGTAYSAIPRAVSITEIGLLHLSRFFGERATIAVTQALAEAGSSAGIGIVGALGAGMALGTCIEYLPTIWGGKKVSYYTAQGLEWALGSAPWRLLEIDDGVNHWFQSHFGKGDV
jgi:hypothetical protein